MSGCWNSILSGSLTNYLDLALLSVELITDTLIQHEGKILALRIKRHLYEAISLIKLTVQPNFCTYQTH